MTLTKFFGNLHVKQSPGAVLFNREMKVSAYIPWTYFVSPDIFMTKNGELGAVIKVEGVPFEVKGFDEINQMQAALGFVLQSLGSEFAIYVTIHRHQQTSNLQGEYPEGFAKELLAAYQTQFSEEQLFVNDIYVSLLLRANETHTKKNMARLEKLRLKNDPQASHDQSAGQLRKFKTALTNLQVALEDYSPKILGEEVNEGRLPQAAVLSFLSVLVNGEERKMTYPFQDIASYVPEKRLFIGYDTIHFQSASQGNDLFGAILSVKAYTPYTLPGLLDDLLTPQFEYITTHSFLGIEKNKAIDLIDLQAKRLMSTYDSATSQISELSQAKDDLASGKISYGFHHNTILILGKNPKSLEEKIAKIIKIYQDKRLVVIRETLNLENAFWAQIPGNASYIKRSAPISSNNFSCFCSLHNYYSGYINQNHLGGALMLVETPSKTPLYFNLHEKASGRKDDFPKGHTTLIGPSNAGKTVIMTTIDAMFQKHGIRSFFFDRNYGCEIYVNAMGGVYNRLLPGEPTGWNPCQLADNSTNRKFLRDFIEVLATSTTKPLSAMDINQIAEVVDRCFGLPFEKRNLSNISSFFRMDFNGSNALSRYLGLSDRNGKAGDRAYLFDNALDNLNLNARTMGFDMTHWLSDAGDVPEELLPISMYLFHRLDSALDGQLTGLYLDEGWQFLNQPYWQKKLEEYLVTWRKRNGFVFFASQLPDKVAASPMGPALIQGSATNIFLANPKAQEADYCGAFKLTRREFEIIRSQTIQSRYFLVKQGHEAAVARINLQGLSDHLSVLSGNEMTVALCAQLRRDMGNDPNKWLPHFYEKRVQ